MRAFIDAQCEVRGDAPFLHFRGRTWSYADLARITDGAAMAFRGLGVARGDRVAVLLPNGPEAVFSWLALLKLGAITAPLHSQLAAAEAAGWLAHLEPKVLIRDTALPSGGADVPAPCAIVLDAAADLPAILANRDALSGVPAPAPDDPADILGTSGTTGRPKGVIQTHRSYRLTGEGFAHWLRIGPADRLFTCLPFSHINARTYSTMGALAAGASLAIEERFSASRFRSWLRDSGATHFNAIGAMLHILLQAPESPTDRDHGVRVAYGAPALGEAAHLAFERRFAVRLVIGYGLTECTFGFIQPWDGPRRLDAMGVLRRHPDPGVSGESRLVDKDGLDVPPGVTGEILLRSPAAFAGYFRDEAATRAAFTPDGWFRTGDLAHRDAEGHHTFVARKKDLIRRRGENLSPAEVEAVLLLHPAVLEAAVIGVPSPLGEEDVAAFVVLRGDAPPPPPTADDLRAHCAARLAPFKVPSLVRFLQALPRTPTQRVARHLLLMTDIDT